MKLTEEQGRRVTAFLAKNRYVVMVLLLGVVLLLLPGDSHGTEGTSPEIPETAAELSAPDFSLEREEARLETILREIRGAGEVRVLLSLRSTASRELAENGENGALVVDIGSGEEEAVSLRYDYPEYQGAVVVCTGADSAGVRLDVLSAVAAFTGLRADRIQVIRMR